MLELLVVLQTHSVSNNQKQITRYITTDKGEISYRCVKSLIASMNYLQLLKPDQIKIKFQVFDDHSDSHFLKRLDTLLKDCKVEYKLDHLDTHGIMPSILKCYEHGRDNGKDLVYFAQDDYLYYETCIWEMVDAYFAFTEKTKMPVCIYPFDDPYRYGITPPPMVTVHLGAKRHWRTAFGTASCFMIDYPTLIKNFDLFDAMGRHEVNSVMEDETINVLFKDRNCLLFTPIPSIALHAQADTEEDPYIDWKSLWDQFAESQTTQYTHLFSTDKKIVLNIGAGETSCKKQIQYFDDDWKELTLDVAVANPNIVSDIVEMKEVPDESVDAIWACHVVEHVYFHQLPKLFESIMRVLKKDGFAIIRVPDIGSIAHMIEDDLFTPVYDSSVGPICPIDILYSSRVLVEKYGEPMAHKTGFTKKSMEQILTDLKVNALINKIGGEIVAILYKDVSPIHVVNDPKFKFT
jgi:SAM-dependent methyltransferase